MWNRILVGVGVVAAIVIAVRMCAKDADQSGAQRDTEEARWEGEGGATPNIAA